MPKILIIRFSSIGDIVLTTPVIRCLKKQLEGAEIHYVTKKSYEEIIKNNPYIDKIHCYVDNIRKIISNLKNEKFDYVIDLHHNLRSLVVKTGLETTNFSFNKLNFEKWLLVNLKVNKMPKVHIVDRYLDTVKHLGVKNDNEGLDYFISDKDKINLNILPKQHQSGYIAFAIGARHNTKKLPLEKIISICKKINYPIILLGGGEDKANAKNICNELGEKVFNACGLYSINQSASIIQQAEKVITHDTGLMHIATAFNKEIISIWGNTVSDFGMFPYYPKPEDKKLSHIIEVKKLSCRPCSKLGFKECPEKHFDCMEKIDEESVVKLAGFEN